MTFDPKERQQLVDDLNMSIRELRSALTLSLQLADRITAVVVLILRVITTAGKPPQSPL